MKRWKSGLRADCLGWLHGSGLFKVIASGRSQVRADPANRLACGIGEANGALPALAFIDDLKNHDVDPGFQCLLSKDKN